jgi:hypothetical protein
MYVVPTCVRTSTIDRRVLSKIDKKSARRSGGARRLRAEIEPNANAVPYNISDNVLKMSPGW